MVVLVLDRHTKAEVGVVFPVNTELQRVRGERFSCGYAEGTTRSLNLKRLSDSQNGSEPNSHTHTHTVTQGYFSSLLLIFIIIICSPQNIFFINSQPFPQEILIM